MRCDLCFAEYGDAESCPSCGGVAGYEASPLALEPGVMLNGKYRLGRLLGKPGGFGLTYLAMDTVLDIRVAIKEYLPRDLAGRGTDRTSILPHSRHDNEDFQYGLEQFLQEARILARFDHFNVVRVRDFFQEHGTAYLVMDYLEGMSLVEYLQLQGGRVEQGLACDIMMPILDALRDVHHKGLLHRDVKPHNIYLSREGRPILLDFGAARQALSGRSKSVSAVATEGYSPLEQYQSRGNFGPWTDVYACGATMYRMVTGRPPFPAMERIIEDELESPARLGIQVDDHFDQAIMRCLALKAEDRFQSIEELQQVLLTGGEGTRATPPEPRHVTQVDNSVDDAVATKKIVRPSAPSPAPAPSSQDDRALTQSRPPARPRQGLVLTMAGMIVAVFLHPFVLALDDMMMNGMDLYGSFLFHYDYMLIFPAYIFNTLFFFDVAAMTILMACVASRVHMRTSLFRQVTFVLSALAVNCIYVSAVFLSDSLSSNEILSSVWIYLLIRLPLLLAVSGLGMLLFTGNGGNMRNKRRIRLFLYVLGILFLGDLAWGILFYSASPPVGTILQIPAFVWFLCVVAYVFLFRPVLGFLLWRLMFRFAKEQKAAVS